MFEICAVLGGRSQRLRALRPPARRPLPRLRRRRRPARPRGAWAAEATRTSATASSPCRRRSRSAIRACGSCSCVDDEDAARLASSRCVPGPARARPSRSSTQSPRRPAREARAAAEDPAPLLALVARCASSRVAERGSLSRHRARRRGPRARGSTSGTRRVLVRTTHTGAGHRLEAVIGCADAALVEGKARCGAQLEQLRVLPGRAPGPHVRRPRSRPTVSVAGLAIERAPVEPLQLGFVIAFAGSRRCAAGRSRSESRACSLRSRRRAGPRRAAPGSAAVAHPPAVLEVAAIECFRSTTDLLRGSRPARPGVQAVHISRPCSSSRCSRSTQWASAPARASARTPDLWPGNEQQPAAHSPGQREGHRAAHQLGQLRLSSLFANARRHGLGSTARSRGRPARSTPGSAARRGSRRSAAASSQCGSQLRVRPASFSSPRSMCDTAG